MTSTPRASRLLRGPEVAAARVQRQAVQPGPAVVDAVPLHVGHAIARVAEQVVASGRGVRHQRQQRAPVPAASITPALRPAAPKSRRIGERCRESGASSPRLAGPRSWGWPYPEPRPVPRVQRVARLEAEPAVERARVRLREPRAVKSFRRPLLYFVWKTTNEI